MKTYKDNVHVKGVQYYYSQYSIADQHFCSQVIRSSHSYRVRKSELG